MQPVVYKIHNKVNNKIYVGSAEDWPQRKRWHLNALRRGDHFNKHLQNAWNLYGEENFQFIIIENLIRKNQTDLEFKKLLVDDREQYYIDILEATNQEKGYNIRIKAGSALGLKRSAQTRQCRIR